MTMADASARTVLKEIFTDWDELVEAVSQMQAGQPFWMPIPYILHQMLPAVAGTAVVCTLVYLLCFYFIVERSFSPHDMKNPLKRSKACYQITNMVFNLTIGCLGLYFEYWILPTLPAYNQGTHLDRIPGHEDQFYLLSAMQFGYQIWAVPVGLWYVKESTEMMFHHLAVIMASTMAGFTRFGFRYYTPYFFGIMELSSVPLAVMNAFKDNPGWMKRYPIGYLVARGLFSFSFLYGRIYMWFSRGPIFLRDNYLVSYTKLCNGGQKVFMLSQWALCMFLGVLQFWWAYLVSRGIASWFAKLLQTAFRATPILKHGESKKID